jgi:hypothetical protein
MNDRVPAVATPDSAANRDSNRSPILNEVRLNPFRVLRLPVRAGVDDAIWKAEEALTLLRAGVADAEPDPLPWLPPPGEPEIRQAVQAAEEPLRRLLSRLSWFDFEADPAGALLRQALASLTPADAHRYFLSPQPARADAPTALASELNRANLSLLLAARAFDVTRPPGAEAPSWQWEKRGGAAVVINPHSAAAAYDRDSGAVELWRRAVSLWVTVLNGDEFRSFLKGCLSGLGDDLIGPDDAESVTNTLWTRLTDLLAGEIKAHLQEGHYERVAVLLRVAADSPVETRRWVLALRALRPKFRAEVTELDVLVAQPAPRFDDIELYLARLGALAREWAALDPGNLMALGELIDEAVGKALGLLSACQDYATMTRVGALLERAREVAVADSVKSKAATAVARLDGLKDYACHFCRKRDMELSCSAIVTGKKETGREHYGNMIRVYYSLRKGFVPRCERCADLHEYLRAVGPWAWFALLPLAVLLAVWRIDVQQALPPYQKESFPILLVIALIAGAYAVSGFLARWIVAGVVTAKGERTYADVHEAKHYQAMAREGYTITLDYSRNAYKAAGAGS